MSRAITAFTVCVNYAPELAICLPHNRPLFSEYVVITHPDDDAALRVAVLNGCRIFATKAFGDIGREFRKYAAMEQALNTIGRNGWIAFIDADVILSKSLVPALESMTPDRIYGCARRMMRVITEPPPEDEWERFPVHPNSLREIAGFCQIFYADDAVLGEPPWHRDPQHPSAGAQDSWLAQKWPHDRRMWCCEPALHLGTPRVNWEGRAA